MNENNAKAKAAIIKQIATKLLNYTIAPGPNREPGAKLLGDIRATEIVILLSEVLRECPKCGTKAWANPKSCDVCELMCAYY